MLPLSSILNCFFKIHCEEVTHFIILHRIIRSATALLIGALLAVSGTMIQGVARNPLAEPYILGLSSTALTFLSAAIIFNPEVIIYKHTAAFIAFVGALVGYFLTTTLSMLAGSSGYSLILAGIAVTSIFSGTSHILLYIVQTKLRMPYHLLLMGSASMSLLQDVKILFLVLIGGISVIYILQLPKVLNAYVFGDDFAKQLGYNPRLIPIFVALIASIFTGVSVAIVGIVGFIGLAAPHITRFLIGSSDHRMTIALSLLTGAILTTLADVITRFLAITIARGEFPLGIVTSIIGAPFLAYLIIKRGKQ